MVDRSDLVISCLQLLRWEHGVSVFTAEEAAPVSMTTQCFNSPARIEDFAW